ncbi:GntR family transcriptional regulator [Bordetella sp. BOR01]|uniref:GntR family transcriptional regulator n=1 Tax=Bordetella sp. BOR01 TaxID=2854779 RepID=UPI001C497A0D|nr:GntR family transcriptional regulator [Bordetella sp. BOR01]MBV7484155.1 GntR family transcriptional regulator [Bordetella sp. BOR01]
MAQQTDQVLDGPARAYQFIREQILTRAYLPGQRLRGQEIAQAIGISRTPIREALGLLEENGLVHKTDWGFVVRALTLADVEDLFKVREVLELEAAREARLRVDDEWIGALRAILERAQAQLESGHGIESIRTSRAIHMSIAQRCGNKYLLKMLKSIDDQVQMVGAALVQKYPQRSAEVLAENRAIVQAFERGDGAAITSAIRSHIRKSLRLHLSNREGLLSG